jgi:hypothetical protein
MFRARSAGGPLMFHSRLFLKVLAAVAFLSLSSSVSPAWADWHSGQTYKMHFPQP